MKVKFVPIQVMCLIPDSDKWSLAERGKMILEYFDELSEELLMK